MTPRPVGFEIAFDAINERWEKADADERAVIRERLASMTLEPEPKDIEEVFEALTWLILDADQCREILGRLAGEFDLSVTVAGKDPEPPKRKRRAKKTPAPPKVP